MMNSEIHSELFQEFERVRLKICKLDLNENHQDWMQGLQPEATMREQIEADLQESPFRERLIHECFEYGPLNPIMSDENITEIVINAFDKIAIEKSGALELLDIVFLSEWSYVRFIKRMVEEGGHKLDLEKPFASFLWKSFRAHVTHPPLNPAGFSVCLRRLKRERPLLMKDLEQLNWTSSEKMETLKQGLMAKKNILVVGSTGSGKTTVLSSFLNHLPETERVVILEDTDEILVPNKTSTKLLGRTNSEKLQDFHLGDLVREALRMRPDRLVIGEIRGPEACDLLMALATGHKGSLATLHASDPKECLLRLEMLIQMGAPHWSLDSIRKLIQLTVDWIVVVEKTKDRRQLRGIFQISSLESSGFLVDPVERFTPSDRDNFPLECTSSPLGSNQRPESFPIPLRSLGSGSSFL